MRDSSNKPFQFNLLALFVLTTLMGIFFGLWFWFQREIVNSLPALLATCVFGLVLIQAILAWLALLMRRFRRSLTGKAIGQQHLHQLVLIDRRPL